MGRRTSRAEVVKINDLLREHLKRVGDTDQWVYDDDWSDQKIAAVVGGGLGVNHVAHVRTEVYGSLRRAGSETSADKIEALEASIKELQQAVLAQARAYEALAGLHRKLCETLALNRVADVKHLGGTVTAPPALKAVN